MRFITLTRDDGSFIHVNVDHIVAVTGRFIVGAPDGATVYVTFIGVHETGIDVTDSVNEVLDALSEVSA